MLYKLLRIGGKIIRNRLEHIPGAVGFPSEGLVLFRGNGRGDVHIDYGWWGAWRDKFIVKGAY